MKPGTSTNAPAARPDAKRPEHPTRIAMKHIALIALLALLTSCATAPRVAVAPRARWTPEQANAWHAGQPWLVGCNFTPEQCHQPARDVAGGHMGSGDH